MREDALSRRKCELRAVARRLPTPDRAGVERAVRERVLGLPEVERAATVSLYAAQGHEVSIDAILATLLERGVRTALPRVAGDDLVLHRVASPDELSPGYRAIREPGPDSPIVPVEDVDVFLVPGLFFDRAGGRLGRGRGHFDRLLAGARPDATRVGLCHSGRLLESIPTGPRDVSVEVVITEDLTLRVAP